MNAWRHERRSGKGGCDGLILPGRSRHGCLLSTWVVCPPAAASHRKRPPRARGNHVYPSTRRAVSFRVFFVFLICLSVVWPCDWPSCRPPTPLPMIPVCQKKHATGLKNRLLAQLQGPVASIATAAVQRRTRHRLPPLLSHSVTAGQITRVAVITCMQTRPRPPLLEHLSHIPPPYYRPTPLPPPFFHLPPAHPNYYLF